MFLSLLCHSLLKVYLTCQIHAPPGTARHRRRLPTSRHSCFSESPLTLYSNLSYLMPPTPAPCFSEWRKNSVCAALDGSSPINHGTFPFHRQRFDKWQGFRMGTPPRPDPGLASSRWCSRRTRWERWHRRRSWRRIRRWPLSVATC